MAAALDYTYQYPFASEVSRTSTGPRLALATATPAVESRGFFDGVAHEPDIVSSMLVALSDVVRTHYFLPTPALLDPVLTSNDSMLRAEGFSGCCGVYARVDLSQEGFDGTLHDRGTTNVDFNEPMRNALRQVNELDNLRFSIAPDGFVASTGEMRVVEKKVKLPVRWLKSFSEVQTYQPELELRYELSAGAGLQLIRSLPSRSPKQALYLTGRAPSLRFSSRKQPNAVALHGTHRLDSLTNLLRKGQALRIWFAPGTGISAWEVASATHRFTLVLSPELYRGFSGEGQVLKTLAADENWEASLPAVKAQLTWQNELDPAMIAKECSLETDVARQCIEVLGARGLAGYDAFAGKYFHRVLPFDLTQVDELQPRLKAARQLVANGGIEELPSTASESKFSVPGTDVAHLVKLATEGDRCTCPWFAKHQGGRGPCKHILAAQLVGEDGHG